MQGLGADLRGKLVDQADVGESTTGHNLIISTTSSVRIEIFRG